MVEPAGFRDYVAARQRALLRSAWLLTGDWQAAEDLVQIALVRVWPRWSRLTESGDADAYVRKTLLNVFLSSRRRRWTGEYATETLPDRPGPDAYGTVDLRDALARVLRSLGRRQRAVIVLRFFEDLPEAEVAAVMGISLGTVKSQTTKALTRLRAEMEHWDEPAQRLEQAGHVTVATDEDAMRRMTR